MTVENVMCKMAELLSAPFSLSTGIRSCFEFPGRMVGGGAEGGQKTAAADPLRIVIKKQPFVCIPEIEFFSISPNNLCQA